MSKPIPFTAPMARANRMKIKTNTRRLVPKKFTSCIELTDGKPFIEDEYGNFIPLQDWAPYQPGDILWQREPAIVIDTFFEFKCPLFSGDILKIKFLADGAKRLCKLPERISDRWNKTSDPASNLPNWISKKQGIPNGCFKEAARTWLKVTSVRVQRLWQISEEDAIAEGVEHVGFCGNMNDRYPLYKDYSAKIVDEEEGFTRTARGSFETLWDLLAKDGSRWEDNPWVWVYRYELCGKPEGWDNA
ncbi:hypothetical protein [Maridesulfovibrio ferrireducens]|uniref:hypothetical protein n=1 Tax=Maridesulfovibrio ferrireducens TaxID=246191 RepID=UPI001A2C1619|nr:hypothetical protein [Maridesulfovibrio ferrireducens]MBI9112221.1 hypothetical protein [Maridesulfovibrio ferrireducens]